MTEKEQKPDEIQWMNSPKGIFEVYANNIHLVWSKDDLRIRLAQLVEAAETLNPGSSLLAVNEVRAAVTIAWRQAKLLRDQLTKVIAAYEGANGIIPLDVVLPKTMKDS